MPNQSKRKENKHCYCFCSQSSCFDPSDTVQGMQLLLLSLLLLKTQSKKSYLVQTRDGKTYLAIGNPKDYNGGNSYWMNISTKFDTSESKSEYYPRQLFSMENSGLGGRVSFTSTFVFCSCSELKTVEFKDCQQSDWQRKDQDLTGGKEKRSRGAKQQRKEQRQLKVHQEVTMMIMNADSALENQSLITKKWQILSQFWVLGKGQWKSLALTNLVTPC